MIALECTTPNTSRRLGLDFTKILVIGLVCCCKPYSTEATRKHITITILQCNKAERYLSFRAEHSSFGARRPICGNSFPYLLYYLRVASLYKDVVTSLTRKYSESVVTLGQTVPASYEFRYHKSSATWLSSQRCTF